MDGFPWRFKKTASFQIGSKESYDAKGKTSSTKYFTKVCDQVFCNNVEEGNIRVEVLDSSYNKQQN